jgi:HK97 family phage major capsid protein
VEITTEQLLKQVTASLEKASGDFSAKAEAAIKEAKAAGDISAQTKDALDKIATEHNTINKALDALKAQLGQVEQMAANGTGTARQRAQAMTAGAQVIGSEALKAFAARVRGNEGTRASIPVKVSAALTSADVPEGIVEPQRAPMVDRLRERLFVRDLITPGQTTAPAIFWVQQTGFTNAARIVPENTLKPYSDIAFATHITPVQTIAHLFKASKQILDDFTQLQALIDSEMRFGLRYVEEQQILFGDGTGNNLHGIVPQATDYDATGIPEGATAIDALRWAMLQAQLARVPATGHVLHAIDWTAIELAKDTLGRYIIGNPQATATPTLWGLPVVVTDAPGFVGNFLTGAFRLGAQLFDREEANVVISSENVNDFEMNLLTIRCEERLALAVYRPEAFIWGALPTAAVTP